MIAGNYVQICCNKVYSLWNMVCLLPLVRQCSVIGASCKQPTHLHEAGKLVAGTHPCILCPNDLGPSHHDKILTMSRSDQEEGVQARKENAEFAFITDQGQNGARSHAMREYWKQRRRRPSEMRPKEGQPPLLPIQPRNQEEFRNEKSVGTGSQYLYPSATSSKIDVHALGATESSLDSTITNTEMVAKVDSLRSQALSGLNRALGSSRLDPFDKFPVTLTTQHHRLLHHCTYCVA